MLVLVKAEISGMTLTQVSSLPPPQVLHVTTPHQHYRDILPPLEHMLDTYNLPS